MKNTFALLVSVFVAATPSIADGLVLSYREIPDGLTITMSHDIRARAGEQDVEAGRTLEVGLSLQDAADGITATVQDVRGTYTAHEMSQRLSNGHLVGLSFPLVIAGDGRSVEAAPGGPVVDLGGLRSEGLDLASAVVGWLPELPSEAVEAGSSWSTERTSRSLEGWAWANGSLGSRHTVVAVDAAHGHSIVTVETEGSARLVAADGASEDVGTLDRTARWRFDATAGRLLSLTIEQQSDGVNVLPQGQVTIHQATVIEISEAR